MPSTEDKRAALIEDMMPYFEDHDVRCRPPKVSLCPLNASRHSLKTLGTNTAF